MMDINKTVFTKFCFIVFFFLGGHAAIGQIVSVDPIVFSLDEEITITYDATQGNMGLVGVSDVFMHTGIITEEDGFGNWQNVVGNWGQWDQNVKMTNIGNDLHQISFTPNEFYNVDGSKTITHLSFVFRNVSGSKEGKTASLGDIFVDVPDPNTYSAYFVSPTEQHIILEQGEQIKVTVAATQHSTIEIFDNGISLASDNGMLLEYDFIATATGTHLISFEATNDDNETIDGQFSFVVLEDNIVVEDPPFPLQSGVNRINESSAILSLYAPMKDHVFVIGSFNDWQLNNEYQMKLSSDMENWWVQLDGLETEDLHTYQYLVDGVIKIADPYSSLILDDQNDNGIAPVLNSVPLDYPSALTSGHVSVFSPTKSEYDWATDGFQKAEKTDLVIYELMMRDFLGDHSFDSLKDTLHYLKTLGVNAIELMPINEFENNQSWGYNVSYHMALDKYYGSPESLKALIDEAHRLDIAVILDIVYNHAFGQSPLVRLYWDTENNRPSADSPYCNTEAKHPYNVGFDLNHESNAVKQYVKQTIAYWIDEYRVDGFRFDLSKGFTQKQSSSDSNFATYDQSRVDILSDYADFIWSIDNTQILILEHFAANTEEKVLSDYGFLLWGNANFNFNEATMGYHENGKSNFAHIYHKNRTWNNPHLIGYMESHDEERLMYKNLKHGNSNEDYDIKDVSTALDRVEMAAAFFLSIPGPKMIWQFGELGYEFSINRCEDGSVNENCRLSPKPIKWEYLQDQNRQDLFDVYKKMITLKTEYTPINQGDVSMSVSGPVKRLSISHSTGNLVVIGNFGTTSTSINPLFDHTGAWLDYLNNTSYMVNDVNQEITLDPGEYLVFLDDANFSTSSTSPTWTNSINIYPNPTEDLLFIDIVDDGAKYQLDLYNSQSQLMNRIFTTTPKSISLSDYPSGVYYLRTWKNNQPIEETLRFVKM